MNLAAYIPFVILAIAVLLALAGVVAPVLKKYRVTIRKVEPKKRHAKPKAKKRKSVWIKVM